MTVVGQPFGQAGAKLAGGVIGQPPNLIDRLVGWPSCDDAVHEDRKVNQVQQVKAVFLRPSFLAV